jgi:hypothetical protein
LVNITNTIHKMFTEGCDYPSVWRISLCGVEYSAQDVALVQVDHDECIRCMSMLPLQDCRWSGCGVGRTVLLEKYLKNWHDDDRLLAVGWREC